MTKKNANAWKIPALALLPALLLAAALLWAPKAHADYPEIGNPPTISLKQGCYQGKQYAVITCDKGWCISYTTDGSAPVRIIMEGASTRREPTNPTGSSSVTVPIQDRNVPLQILIKVNEHKGRFHVHSGIGRHRLTEEGVIGSGNYLRAKVGDRDCGAAIHRSYCCCVSPLHHDSGSMYCLFEQPVHPDNPS